MITVALITLAAGAGIALGQLFSFLLWAPPKSNSAWVDARKRRAL
jgi:hypothetical protein